MAITITATELKTNLGKYLDMLKENNMIYVTKNGKLIAKLSNPNVDPVEGLSGILKGKLPDDFDEKSIREERLRHRGLID